MEIEIKLQADTRLAAEAAFFDEDTLPSLGGTRHIIMNTAYYDDPEGSFAARRQTLRLRREDGKGIVTFKTALVGLRRLELEADADSIEAGAAALLLMDALPADARESLEKGRFVPVCGAAFSRDTRRCRFESAELDLCLDRGILFCENAKAPLLELELELARGSEEALSRAAEALIARWPLTPLSLSKQQRAMALRDKERR